MPPAHDCLPPGPEIGHGDAGAEIDKLYQDRVLAGFAGTAADAFTLFARFESKLEAGREPGLSARWSVVGTRTPGVRSSRESDAVWRRNLARKCEDNRARDPKDVAQHRPLLVAGKLTEAVNCAFEVADQLATFEVPSLTDARRCCCCSRTGLPWPKRFASHDRGERRNFRQ